MTSRVAVTGATGFIGTALVQALSAGGFEVLATDRYQAVSPLPVHRFLHGDIRDPRLLTELTDSVDVVFHLAALPSIARAPWEQYRAVNAEGTATLAETARRAGVRRFVHLSSSTVYGVPSRCPVGEDAALQPGCHYSRSKLMAEEAVRESAAKGLSSVIIRPRVVVGRGRAGIFALLFTLLRLNLPVPLVGAGRNRFQFTAIDDLISACELAAQRDGEELEIYNIGCDVTRTLAQELRALISHARSRSVLVPVPAGGVRRLMRLAERFGVNPLVEEQYRIADVNFVLDTTRAKQALGFVPRSSNVEGLIEAWTWWQARHRTPLSDLRRWWRPTAQNALQKRGNEG